MRFDEYEYADDLARRELERNCAPRQCAVDVGFGMRCRREAGHAGFHTWDPKKLLGEEPVSADNGRGAQ